MASQKSKVGHFHPESRHALSRIAESSVALGLKGEELLITIGLIVSLSPVIYQSIEKIEMVLVSVILIFLVFAIFIATEGSVWAGVVTQAAQGIADFPQTMATIGVASSEIRAHRSDTQR